MARPVKTLFLSLYPIDGASARYRVYQFIPQLERLGIECTVDDFYSADHYRLMMSSGAVAKKIARLARAYAKRIAKVLQSGRYDVVFFHREAAPVGPVFLEPLARRLGARTIFDFDDAIFTPQANPSRFFNLLKSGKRIERILGSVDCVCAGNDFLADHARRFNSCVEMIPGAEDMSRYDVEPKGLEPGTFTVGWTGSPTTDHYLELLKPALQRLAARIDNFRFVVIGSSGRFQCPGVRVVHLPWSRQDEAAFIRSFDVGVMPLGTDSWSKGKCGGKARIYMAAGVPPVASAVSYNHELIDNGRTGILVEPDGDWFEPIYGLYNNPGFRRQMAAAARRQVAETLSVEVIAPQMAEMIRRVATGRS